MQSIRIFNVFPPCSKIQRAVHSGTLALSSAGDGRILALRILASYHSHADGYVHIVIHTLLQIQGSLITMLKEYHFANHKQVVNGQNK